MQHFRPRPKGYKPYIPPTVSLEEMKAMIENKDNEIEVIVLEEDRGYQVPIKERYCGDEARSKALELAKMWDSEKHGIKLCDECDKFSLIEELKKSECYTMMFWANPYIVVKRKE